MARPKKGATAPTQEVEMDVMEFQAGRMEVCILGRTTMLLNRKSEKAIHELLLPSRRMNRHQRETTLKHNPPEEFRSSAHITRDPASKTAILMPSACFKNALRSAAADTAGSSKAEIGRLTFVEGEYVQIYGVPTLHMTSVIQAGIARTPDIRTRAALRDWACRISITFMCPKITERMVLALLANAGLINGMGDARIQKGYSNYGQFELVSPTDARYLAVLKSGGRAAQLAAFDDPVPYDEDSARLLAWWKDEVARRSMQGADQGADEMGDEPGAHLNGAGAEA